MEQLPGAIRLSIFKLKSHFSPQGDQPAAIKTLVDKFQTGTKRQTLLGVTGSGKTFTMANVIAALGKKTLVMAHNKTLAAQLYGELKDFFPENAVEYFVSYYDYYQPEAYVPQTDTFIEKDSSINDDIDKLRHRATRSLLERDDVIVVASVSCIYGIGSPVEYESLKIILFSNDEIERDELLRRLIFIQYIRNDIDFVRGTFRVRGDVVEIFPAHEDSKVIRIEFFGDIIERISLVDPLRGRKLEELSQIIIYPKSHYVVGKQRQEAAITTIKVELRERLMALKAEEKLLEHERLEQRTMYDLEMLEEMGYCSGIENYSRHLTGMSPGDPPPTLIDYFKKNFLLIVDESHMTLPQVGGMFRGDRARKETLVNFGFRLPSALDNRPLKFDEFEARQDLVLYVSATPADYELAQTRGEFVEQVIRPTGLLDPRIAIKGADNQVDDMLEESKKVIAQGERVLITTLTKKLAEELTNFYKAEGMKVEYLHSDISTLERVKIIQSLRDGECDILVGINLLREGIDLPEVSLVGILDADKEGFLRSERALIQTIGRAARNVNGRVILYCYRETTSMRKAVDETNRRRKIQEEFNQKNNIIPTTIAKRSSRLIMEKENSENGSFKKGEHIISQCKSIEDLDKKIQELTGKMRKASKRLRFEEAAALRDEIKLLVDARLLL
ncbi:MAG: excinuclease ABC subunit B [Bdellovibrionales bacterium RIFOXYD12_FULL_39_22]|nr:MAG: excinuclease ABC subunit B [Bdellovibrionales bacterium RIFOXYB1_FULL_39_21]OFZ42714.1 MAG: excinuclease ABC subunit B [Bdellovibrionales bacterium RIFOXYC12_FULL_39_17]OFZ47273.1 MAG: excinuclease ABC subunit B [Bdellovibrionales bacterium RIFOXYC1_FULL_39_130]OFZ73471.1 MAG: excinuclease ABC subunit B [Bdellovibrionales bacterium RIFOXYC2_FULL_39_8]OFZ75439.1 MAG: excinuclease ABC subunit B [Bdellovibrionales bacterium RIFOXYD1_FULL_39_84]OFZ93393.1 MAG: excinuclease ABC subunit B [B